MNKNTAAYNGRMSGVLSLISVVVMHSGCVYSDGSV